MPGTSAARPLTRERVRFFSLLTSFAFLFVLSGVLSFRIFCCLVALLSFVFFSGKMLTAKQNQAAGHCGGSGGGGVYLVLSSQSDKEQKGPWSSFASSLQKSSPSAKFVFSVSESSQIEKTQKENLGGEASLDGILLCADSQVHNGSVVNSASFSFLDSSLVKTLFKLLKPGGFVLLFQLRLPVNGSEDGKEATTANDPVRSFRPGFISVTAESAVFGIAFFQISRTEPALRTSRS